MSYAIVSPSAVSLQPVYSHLSGDPSGLGAFWNKKAVRKRVKARKAVKKAARKEKRAAKGGGLLKRILQPKKARAAARSYALKKTPVIAVAEARTTKAAPTVTTDTAALAKQLAAQEAARIAAMQVAPSIPWVPIAIGVGAAAALAVTIALVRR